MRWKFHASVIAIITLLLLGMYMLFKSSPEATIVTTAAPATQLRVANASWGLNCNALYSIYKQREEEMDRNRKNAPPGSKIPAAPKSPATIIPADNVLETVKKMCDSQPKCTIPANAAVLGDVFSNCSKVLEVSWRCFNYDKLHTQNAQNGRALTIDCDAKNGASPQ